MSLIGQNFDLTRQLTFIEIIWYPWLVSEILKLKKEYIANLNISQEITSKINFLLNSYKLTKAFTEDKASIINNLNFRSYKIVF